MNTFINKMYGYALRIAAIVWTGIIVVLGFLCTKLDEYCEGNEKKHEKESKCNFRGIPLFITLIVLAWARKEGYLDSLPGLRATIDLVLTVFDEIYGLMTAILVKMGEFLKIPETWNRIKDILI